MKNEKSIDVNASFFLREAEHAAGTFFAPIVGAYEAVVASVDKAQEDRPSRKAGAGFARFKRRMAKLGE